MSVWRHTRLPLALLAAAALAMTLPAAAAAQFQPVFEDFRQGGRVDACSFSPGQLGGALDGVPPDIEAYAPNFIDEVNRALESQAACGPSPAPGPDAAGAGADGAATPPGAPGEPRRVEAGPTPEPPALSRRASNEVLAAGADAPVIAGNLSGGGSLPATLIALAAALASTLLGTLAWLLIRARRGGPLAAGPGEEAGSPLGRLPFAGLLSAPVRRWRRRGSRGPRFGRR